MSYVVRMEKVQNKMLIASASTSPTPVLAIRPITIYHILSQLAPDASSRPGTVL